MKKALSLLVAAALCAALCAGCAGKEKDAPETTDCSAADLAASLLASQSERPEFYYVTEADSVFSAYAALYLGEELADRVRSGVICYPVGPLASEVAVFEMDSANGAKEAPEPMAEYLNTRVAAFYGYAPQEAELAENGQIRVMGKFAVLFILTDADGADSALEDAFSGKVPLPDLDGCAVPLRELEEPDVGPDIPAVNPVTGPTESSAGSETSEPAPTAAEPTEAEPTQPGRTEPEPTQQPEPTEAEPTQAPSAEPDEYDHDKVLSALRGKTDPAALMPKNRAVYEAASALLAETVTADMTAYEKELAVNDYLVFHAEYDPAELSSGPVGTPDPDNANPYGLLVRGVGICLGYASTFQLLMDALDIECLTVRGYAYTRGEQEDHAWNLVKLDGDWYAVDVTWNDPVFTDWIPDMSELLFYAHSYFNVTSDYLRDTGHSWSGNVPEAEGTRWAYGA